MTPLVYAVMGFGAVLALTGIALFARKGAEGANAIRVLGMEFRLAGSSLVIFVLGVLIFVAPILYPDRFAQFGSQAATATTDDPLSLDQDRQAQPHAPPLSESSRTGPSGSGRTVASLAQEIRSLVAGVLKVKPETLDMNKPLQDQGADDLNIIEFEAMIGARYQVDVNAGWKASILDLARAVHTQLRIR